MFGLLEIGGTKIIAGVANRHGEIVDRTRIATSDPNENLAEVIDFFHSVESTFEHIVAIGVATFGPVRVDPDAADYGTILKTPKPGWSHFSIRKTLQKAFDVQVEVTTDVNGALLAEVEQGAAIGLDDAVYVTVGTGVGAGIMVNGRLANGFLHPELGHMRVPNFGVAGVCPFHGDCVEGLVCGPAIEQRFGIAAHDLPADHAAWDEIAAVLADMCINLLLTLSTRRIILGGGVMAKEGLLDKIRQQFEARMANYLSLAPIGGVDELIVGPELQQDNGLLGALSLVIN